MLLDHVLCSAGLSMIGNNLMLHRVIHVWWSGTWQGWHRVSVAVCNELAWLTTLLLLLSFESMLVATNTLVPLHILGALLLWP